MSGGEKSQIKFSYYLGLAVKKKLCVIWEVEYKVGGIEILDKVESCPIEKKRGLFSSLMNLIHRYSPSQTGIDS